MVRKSLQIGSVGMLIWRWAGRLMRILLISYYFPPCGGAAVQRWLKWLPELVENGFDVTVLTTRDGDYPVVDISLLQDIPSQVKVIRCGAPSVARFCTR